MNKIIKTILAIVVIVFAATLIVKSGNKSSEHIRLGSVEGLTGVVAFWGESSKKGMELAIEDLKKDGVDVEIIFEDSQGKADVAVTAAQKLINIDKVDALFTNFSGPSSAVSPIAKVNNMLYFYSGLDSTITKNNPYAFKSFIDGVTECKVISEYAKNEMKINKIAYVGLNWGFLPPCLDEMKKVFGEENVISEIAQSAGETDFRSSLLKVKNFGAGMIVTYGYESNYEAIMKQRVELGVEAPLFCVKADCYTEKIAKNVPLSSLEGSILFDYSVTKEFGEKIKAKYGDAVNPRSAAISYDIVNYMVHAVQNCKDDAECMKNDVSNNTEYKSVINKSSYGGDQVFDLKNHYELVSGGELKEIDLN